MVMSLSSLHFHTSSNVTLDAIQGEFFDDDPRTEICRYHSCKL